MYHEKDTTITSLPIPGKLYPNVKGCGYPSKVECHTFARMFGHRGESFPSLHSTLDTSLVITQLDYTQVTSSLFYSTAIPFSLFLLSTCYLVMAYAYIYSKDTLEQNPSSSTISAPDVLSMSKSSPLATSSDTLMESHSLLGSCHSKENVRRYRLAEDKIIAVDFSEPPSRFRRRTDRLTEMSKYHIYYSGKLFIVFFCRNFTLQNQFIDYNS